MEREIFRGFIKIHILYHASKEEIWGVGIIAELKRHGYSISPGTLYPALHSMEKLGYLSGSSRVVGGKYRRYYRITQQGEKMLERAREKIKELTKEVMEIKDLAI